MEAGIIGLPNAGKTTLFNALTRAKASVGNFPFTTINPNVGVVPLPDPRLEFLAKIFLPQKTTPAVLKVVDVAGLVKNAHKGEGLGNKFLSEIRPLAAIIMLLRGFALGDIASPLGEIDPKKEKDILETELILADLEMALANREKLLGAARSGEKNAQKIVEVLEYARKILNNGQMLLAEPEFLKKEREIIKRYQFLTAKPQLIVINVGTPEEAKKFRQEFPRALIISAKTELELSELSPAESILFRQEMLAGIDSLDHLIRKIKELLNLITFFTVVGTEIRAWHIPNNSSALEAAATIHTDLAAGFIKAEVYNYTELEKFGSEKILAEKGLIRFEGKNYLIKEGDILKIHFSPAPGR